MRTRQLGFLAIVLVFAIIFVFADPSSHQQPVRPGGLSTHGVNFGSGQAGTAGSLMPSNVVITTSFKANQTLSRFIVATLNVFPYQISPGTELHLGLYVNGQLASSQNYTPTGPYRTPATIVSRAGNDVANFSNSMLGFTVSDFPIGTFPPGTVVSVTAWVSKPIWVQIDPASSIHSFQTVGVASYSPVARIALDNVGTVCPSTVSIGLESNGE